MGLAIWFACGRRLLFFALAYLTVPGVSWFRVPARALFLANLAGAVLAGLGVETLQIHGGRSQFWHKFAVRFAAVFVIGLACPVLDPELSWIRQFIAHRPGGGAGSRRCVFLVGAREHDSLDPGRMPGSPAGEIRCWPVACWGSWCCASSAGTGFR